MTGLDAPARLQETFHGPNAGTNAAFSGRIHTTEPSTMITRPIPGIDTPASVLALGTWAIGGEGWGGSDRAEDVRALRAGLDEGINFIDTAPIYGFGLCEEIVGEAIAGRRNEVILATKCGLRWNRDVGEFSYEDGAGNRIHRALSPESIREELEDSLRRLNVETIDLYQTHWQTPSTAIEDTMAELMKQKAAGKIRAIGVSNAEPADFARYRAAGEIASVQEMFSMVDRDQEFTNFATAREHGIATLVYSPLAMGLLSGNCGPERVFGDDDNRSWSPRFSVENRREVAGLIDGLKPIATDLDLTLPQLIIRWTLSRPNVTHVLNGARTVAQAKENAISAAAELDPAATETIDRLLDLHAISLPHPFLPET